MTPPLWQLDRHHARLELAQFEGTIDLSRPGEGLGTLRFQRRRLADARLLGIAIPSFPAGDADSVVECYVRSTDLVAVYRESEDWPVQVEARWRAGSRSTPDGPMTTVELAVSVHTALLDSEPEFSVHSVLPTEGVWRLVDQSTARFELLDPHGPARIHPDDGPGCLLFRLPESTLSYVEMVHPADFLEDRLEGGTESEPTVLVHHRLFGGRLEKGVILRARVCGAFLAGDGDLRSAAACFAGFAATELPLGT
jgi:hypothetical protein